MILRFVILYPYGPGIQALCFFRINPDALGSPVQERKISSAAREIPKAQN